MSRILSIDYGKRRTGLAISDELQIIANGLTTIFTTNLIDFLKDYIPKENINCIVLGYPLKIKSSHTNIIKDVDNFIYNLKKLFPAIQIEKEDERFTSVIAKKTIIEAGLSRKKRQNKALVDKISATLILQSFLDRKVNSKT